MVLVDTSIWIDHLRHSDSGLATLLDGGDAVCHPLVIGELACGHLHPRREVLYRLALLPSATMATQLEVLAFIEAHRLSGLGLGYVDMHILAAGKLDGLRVWSRDKAMRAAAEKLKIAF